MHGLTRSPWLVATILLTSRLPDVAIPKPQENKGKCVWLRIFLEEFVVWLFSYPLINSHFVWLNLRLSLEGRTQIENVREHGTGGNIWRKQQEASVHSIRKRFIICGPHSVLLGRSSDGVWSDGHGRDEKWIQSFDRKIWRGETTWKT
jgi:hypothetical protein